MNKSFNFIFMVRMLNILVIVTLSSLACQGQIYTRPNNSYGVVWNRSRSDSTLLFATYCGAPVGTAGLHSINQKMSALYYDSCGHRGYIFDPADSSWTKIGATRLNESTVIIGRDTITSGTGSDAETFYGTIYQKSSWSNLNDFTVNGATASITGDSISISGGTDTYSKTLDLNYTTLLNRWKFVMNFRVGDTSSTSYGIGVGLNGINGWSGHQHDIIAKMSLTTGFLTLENNQGNGTYTIVAGSNSNLTFSEGDILQITEERILDSVYATVRNFTSPNFITCAYQWSTTSSAVPISNTGKFAVYAFGGAQTIDSIAITSKAIKNADILIAGDSKSVYYASQYSRLYGQRLSQYYNVELNAGPGDRTPELIARLPEIKALSPKQVLIQEFRNDTASGLTFAQSIANLHTITDSLTAWGISYYFIPFYEPTIDLSKWNSYFITNYPTHYIDTWSVFQTGFLQDGIHPTDAGQDTLTKIILNSFKLKGGDNKLDLFAGKINAKVINSTPGSILFVNGRNNLSEDNANLFWDYSLKRLGVGTATPTSPLNVIGGATVDTIYGGSTSGDSLCLSSTSNGTKGKIWFGSNNGGTQYREASGFWGIGVPTGTNPAADIHVFRSGLSSVFLQQTAAGGGNGARFLLQNDIGTQAQMLLMSSTGAFLSNGLIFSTSGAGGMGIASLNGPIYFSKSTTVSGTNILATLLTSNGNFGIGAGLTSPTAKLHLTGGTATAGTAPLKLTAGTNLTSPEAGAVEFDGSHYYGTIGSTRYQLDQQRGYSIYTALLSQSGTSDPTAVILGDNTIGSIVWTRDALGAYSGTLSGAFTASKTFILIGQNADGITANCTRSNNNAVQIKTYITASGGSTDVFSDLSIEIRVYP
jgi:hypothetical protein